MTSFTLQSQVDSEGHLSVSLPAEFQGESVTVVVQVNPKNPLEVLGRTVGSIPDLENPPQVDVRAVLKSSEISPKASTGSGRDWDRAMLYDRFDGREEE